MRLTSLTAFLYPNAKIAIGPALKDRFYYDIDVDVSINEEELLKIENKPVDKYLSFLKIQHSSLEHPGVNCIIVANDQYSTPVAYDYKNNLKGNPMTYSPENNNKLHS